MNAPPIQTPQPRNWLLSISLLILVMGCLMIGLVVYGITSFIRLGSDERALRNGLLNATAAPWERKLELNVGTVTTQFARLGLLFAHLDSRAQIALRAVCSGEVGIYKFDEHASPINRAAMLAEADKAMDRRGWDRLVGVVNSENLVAVYVPRKTLSETDLKVCVAVIDDGQLVIASARSNIEALMELVRERPEWQSKFGTPARIPAVFK